MIYIKQSLGRLSALCGCVALPVPVVETTWLMARGRGVYEQVAFAVQNMIANLTGMICDGAETELCALKVMTGVCQQLCWSATVAVENHDYMEKSLPVLR